MRGARLRLGVLASGHSDSCMLIDVHAHFYHDRSPRADWRERNASRLAAGEKIGITIHVASILGSWGRTSPTYFPSPADLPYGNAALLALGHVGGGGAWQHSLAALRAAPNVYVDLSGSGVDGGMLESCLAAVGVERLLWGSDITMDTGWAKLRYLTHLLSRDEADLVKWKNAVSIFPHGAFPSD